MCLSKQDRPSKVTSFSSRLEPVDQLAAKQAERKLTPREVREIEQMREQAKAQGYREGSELGRSQGMAQGYEQGKNLGREDAKREFDSQHAMLIHQFADGLQSFLQKAEEELHAFLDRAESELAGLAVEIAQRALAQELALGQESVAAIAKESLAEVTQGAVVRIRANPLGVGVLEARREELLAALANLRGLEVVSDPAIQGGCVIEYEGGVVDARVESYLSRIARTLQEAA